MAGGVYSHQQFCLSGTGPLRAETYQDPDTGTVFLHIKCGPYHTVTFSGTREQIYSLGDALSEALLYIPQRASA
jgi:hypothetical protein